MDKLVVLDEFMVQSVVDEVDRNHAEGKTATNQIMRNFLCHQYEVSISRKTMAKYMSKLGLEWKPVKAKKKCGRLPDGPPS